jgi:hypothetical protein
MKTGAGNEYYFNPMQMEGDLVWNELAERAPLQAEIMRLPNGDKAGAVRKVRRIVGKDILPESAASEPAR